MSEAKFDKREVWGTSGKSIKLRKDENFVSFMKFKRKLFAMTNKRIYEIVEVK